MRGYLIPCPASRSPGVAYLKGGTLGLGIFAWVMVLNVHWLVVDVFCRAR